VPPIHRAAITPASARRLHPQPRRHFASMRSSRGALGVRVGGAVCHAPAVLSFERQSEFALGRESPPDIPLPGGAPAWTRASGSPSSPYQRAPKSGTYLCAAHHRLRAARADREHSVGRCAGRSALIPHRRGINAAGVNRVLPPLVFNTGMRQIGASAPKIFCEFCTEL